MLAKTFEAMPLRCSPCRAVFRSRANVLLAGSAYLPQVQMAATKSYRSSPKIACIINVLTCEYEPPLGSTNNISILEQKFERSRSAEIVLRNASGTSRL